MAAIVTAKNIFVVVGEASGDAHAGRLLAELKQTAPNINVKGIGGDSMRAAGAEIIIDFSELAVMGLVEVLKRYRSLKKIFNKVVALLKQERPDLLVLVDYPGFNLKLAKEAKKLGIPVLYYISPKVWAWKAGRVKTIKRVVNHMAVLFPFEVPIYEQASVPVTCVGHPLVDAVKVELSKQEIKTKMGMALNRRIVGLFPGSRRSEVEALLPVMLKAAEKLQQSDDAIDFVMPLASGLDSSVTENMLAASKLNVRVVSGDFYELTTACDAVVAASGTVTLEIALLGVPHFLVYRVSPITYTILKRLVHIPYVGLCNIITGKNTVLELLQHDVTDDRLATELKGLLNAADSQQKATHIQQQVLSALGPSGGAHNAAKLVADIINKSE